MGVVLFAAPISIKFGPFIRVVSNQKGDTPSMPTRLSHPFLKFVLFFVLSLAIGMPTTALAAPTLQGGGTAESEAVLVAYYESDAITIEDAEDIVVGLSFYEDATFDLSIDLGDGEGPSVAYGDYEETDDGVLLTLIGADGEDFDESTELELVYDADDTLVIPGDADGLFGEEDVILYPMEVEPGDDTGDEADAGTGDEAGEETMYAVGGVYISPIQPTEGSDGVVYMLNLLADGSASLSSDYLNMEAPLFEIGTWTDNGDDTVTVDITGTLEEEYDEAIAIELTVGDGGTLDLADFSLYPLIYLGQDMSDDSADSGDEIGNDDSDVFIYYAEVPSADSDELIVVYMLLYDDGTVVLTDEEETETLYGEWTFEDEVLTVSITGNDEETFDDTTEVVFEFDEDSNLVATEYPEEVFGQEGLTFYPAEDSDGSGDEEAVTEGEFYIYESDVLENSETDGIVISLILGADGGAMVSTDWMNDEDPVLEYGTWTRDEDGAVVVTLAEGPEGEYDEPFIYTFEEDPDDLSLNLIDESVEAFGDAGLVLKRVE